MRTHLILAILVLCLAWPSTARSKTDLVTLPKRDSVQLTIYNSADLTLVRDQRALTLAKGDNRLQFSWAGTLIDPTSLELLPRAQAAAIDVQELSFPPRIENLGLWRLQSQVAGKVDMEISYLTSGLTWRAFYLGLLEPDQGRMRLQGYVRVANESGEDYENAQVRLLVGKINLIDQISDLAQRIPPYGRPGPRPLPVPSMPFPQQRAMMAKEAFMTADADLAGRPKEIVKEGLSEYFLYSIAGTETIPSGWSRRLLSFEAPAVPVVSLFKHEEERFGQATHRFLSFANDKAHSLGDTPIPGGVLKLYRRLDQAGHRTYEGQSEFKYVPVGEDVELDLGPVEDVLVRPTLMSFKTAGHLFDRHGNVDGWDEIREYKIEVVNTRAVPAKVEITRNFPTAAWRLTHKGEGVVFAKKDLDTATFKLDLGPGQERTFSYVLTTRHGRRAE